MAAAQTGNQPAGRPRVRVQRQLAEKQAAEIMRSGVVCSPPSYAIIGEQLTGHGPDLASLIVSDELEADNALVEEKR